MKREKMSDEEKKRRQKERTREWQRNNPEKFKAHYLTYKSKNVLEVRMSNIRARAKKDGLEFNLTIEDFVIPSHCPVLGIELDVERSGAERDNFASMDRIKNDQGYIKGNVHWISNRANKLKNNATNEELMKVALYFSNLSTRQAEGSLCTSDPIQ